MGNSKSIHSPEPLEVPGIGRFGDLSLRKSLRGSKKMDRLRRSFRDSFRRRKDRVPESLKPYQWQADETAVRNGTCTFQVKYLGCVEVFESRGMLVCEEALRVLRNVRKRPIRAVLHVSGDGLRVVEEDTKGLLVDQTIEKVSFCAPDKLVEKGFSYICRDGTTRRWMCHGFLTVRETGERLSHAVGCAFAVCLERKQIRDRECTVSYAFDNTSATFTRSGSFRKASLTEQQEQRASAAGEERENERPPRLTHRQQMLQARRNPFAIERPHATPLMLERQSSFRGFSQLSQSSSPFKRQMSLRITDLPSNSERQKIFLASQQQQKSHNQNQRQQQKQQQQHHHQQQQQQQKQQQHQPDNNNESSVTALCQQLTKGLNLLSTSNQSLNDNDFNTKGVQDLFDPLNITTTGSININFNNSISNNFCHISQTNNQNRSPHHYDNSNNSNSHNRKSDFESGGVISNEPIKCLTSSTSANEQLLSEPVLGAQQSANSSSSQLPNPDQWLGNISNAFVTAPSFQLGEHHNHLIEKLTKNSTSSRAISFDENFSHKPFSSPSLPVSPLPSPSPSPIAKTPTRIADDSSLTSLDLSLPLAEKTSTANVATASATVTTTANTPTSTSKLPLSAVSSPANNTIKDPFDVQWADTVITSDLVQQKPHLNDELTSSLSSPVSLPPSSDVRFSAETIDGNSIIPKNTTNPFLVNS